MYGVYTNVCGGSTFAHGTTGLEKAMAAKAKLVFETNDGEIRVEAASFKEARSLACRELSVSGPRSLHFYEVGGDREFFESLYDGEGWYTDAAGRKHI